MLTHFKPWGKRLALLALVAVLATLMFAAPTQAAGPNGPTRFDLRAQRMFGVLPAIGSSLSQSPRDIFGNLDYHGGPVMHTNTVYLIYWIPSGYSVSTNYKKLINGFFKNVAAADGLHSNVYFSDTQYFDTVASVQYKTIWGGAFTDTNAFPSSGCSDVYTSICLTDAQINTEIMNVMAAKGWKAGPNRMYFMFTPKDVGTCDGTACSYTTFCAYHSYTFNSSNRVVLYANMPYAAWQNCNVASQPQPNGDDADYTINVASHEHNETITDEQGTAWWDSLTGNENGDNCAWNFGTAIGSTTFGQYNQAIGTGKYYLQQEWSNFSTACVLKRK